MSLKALPISVNGLKKGYGTFLALDDVSISIRPGEFLTLLGPSGSGKTTLLMAMAGFVRPDKGSIEIGGRDITRLPPNKRDIGIVFQNYALFPHMSVLANVAYPLRLRNVPRKQAIAQAEAALARVKLEGFGDRSISALSGGQRQRVALARAVVFEPRIMLMDEPLSALDKNLREQMQFEIRRLHDDLGITTIYVTHDQREALTMSDRIAVMDRGRIQQLDEPQKIYNRPLNRFVAHFLGEANILASNAISGLPSGFPATSDAMIRAESFDIQHDGKPHVTIKGSLVAKAFRGENWLIQVDIGEGQHLLASLPADRSAQCQELVVGQNVILYASPSQIHAIASERPQ